MKNKSQCYEFYVNGMHCAACELLIENKLIAHNGIASVEANLVNQKIIVQGDFGKKSKQQLASEISKLVEHEGYKIVTDKITHQIKWNEFVYAVPIAFLIITIFIILQKVGVLSVYSNATTLPFFQIFVLGIVASLSSCMAIVGGLVLSFSSAYAKDTRASWSPHVSFHISRLVGFFIMGGLLGILGSTFLVNATIYSIMQIFVSIFMFILALDLLDIVPWVRKLQPRLPKFISKKAKLHVEKKIGFSIVQNIVIPGFFGILTFIIPCAFTANMQIQALATGNFFNGAMTMLVFAIGTFPILAGISIFSKTLGQRLQSGMFFKIAAIIIIFFVLLDLLGSLTLLRILPPILKL